MKEYLTAAEAAEYTGISVSKLSKLRQNASGCTYIKIGTAKTKSVIRYKRSDLDDWLAGNKIKTLGGV